MLYDLAIAGMKYRLDLAPAGAGWACRLDGCDIPVDAALIRPGVLSLRIADRIYEVILEPAPNGWNVWLGNRFFAVEVRDPRSLRGRVRAIDDQGPRNLIASMPGKVVRILVREKEEVEAGAGIIVVEAMKMQNEIKAPRKGIIRKISVSEGAAVNAGDILAIIE